MIVKIRCKAFLAMILLLLVVTQASAVEKIDSKSKQIEKKADRAFIRGHYEEAMKFYTQAEDKATQGGYQKYKLELKMARLYTLLQEPAHAIQYYQQVHAGADTMMTVNDACFYIDALRQEGDLQQAEVVARSFAFQSAYSRNQRYQNTLNSLQNHQYYGQEQSDLTVKLYEKSSSLAEFWMGQMQGQLFYAISYSPIQDPLKVFYHRTQYFAVSDQKSLTPFHAIPRELQSGPVAFTADNTIMVATGISYRDKARIIEPGSDEALFRTQLYFSRKHPKSGGWSRFQPLFEFQKESNYAHPTFLDDGKSIIFSSDRPGTHGGMDLFLSSWDERTNIWTEPVNLGTTINTEGNELYPYVLDDALFFSSNGQEGLGGYDIYRIGFSNGSTLPGSIFHYPAPLNSSWNDFGIFFDTKAGYFISDRRGMKSKDDIYTFDRALSSLTGGLALGVSEEFAAMNGNLNLIRGLSKANSTTAQKNLNITPNVPNSYGSSTQEEELLLTIYFDFDSEAFTVEAIDGMNGLISSPEMNALKEVSVVGYADEFGSAQYNKRLSAKRAQAVTKYLKDGGFAPELSPEGKGRIALSQEEYQEALQQQKLHAGDYLGAEIKNYSLPFSERVQLTKRARRVEVIIKRK